MCPNGRETVATVAERNRRSDPFYLPEKRMTVAVAVNDDGWPLEDTAAELMYTALEREAQ